MYVVLFCMQAFGVWDWLHGVVIFIKCHSVLIPIAGFYDMMAFLVIMARK